MGDQNSKTMTGGALLVRCLEEQGVKRAFCVPGESYLAVLDAMHDSSIRAVIARHEGGAAMMAEAEGKLSGRPGICFVTRGPGATNASSGIHVAQQDSTPMILFVGQISRDHTHRDAFQEVDYRALFGGMAKAVEEVTNAARLPEIISRAYHTAMSGRPGPVVIALPEDMLREEVESTPSRRVEVAEASPSAAQMDWVEALLKTAERPMVIVGGSRWNPEAVRALNHIAERWLLPVTCSFRRQGLFDHEHFCYAGDTGLGINPALRERIEQADVLLMIGARFSENPSQGFSLLNIPEPTQRLIHVHPGPEELGRIYTPSLPVNSTPGGFLSRLLEMSAPDSIPWSKWTQDTHNSYLEWSGTLPDAPGSVTMANTMQVLKEALPADAILTNGAGNYTAWLHRFYRFRRYGSQLAPISGSMGYGLPAAIAAKLAHPNRDVVCFAGDGCLQMTVQEMATAAQEGAHVIVLACDNGQYGTIRMHQEREYPGRQVGTQIVNPDFASLAAAYGWFAERVEEDAGFQSAFDRARESGRPALLHLPLDRRVISPGRVFGDPA